MKYLYLLIFMFLLGCTLPYTEMPMYNSYPDGFVRSIGIDSKIIDVAKEQISTKEELLEYFDYEKGEWVTYFDHEKGEWVTYFRDNGYSYYLSLSITGEIDASVYEYAAYIKPLCQNKMLLNTNVYASGMPISINSQRKDGRNDERYITSYDGYIYQSKQQIILLKGDTEYWVDSSYEHNGEKFTILPVCDNSEHEIGELRFTYTVEKVKKSRNLEVYNEN